MDKKSSMKLMAWNVQSGGFDSYTPAAEAPARGPEIESFISVQRQLGVRAMSLTDALKWDAVYGGDQGIADHLGYEQARFVPINDERIDRDVGPGIGLVFATDVPIEQSRPLDMENRQGLGTVLDIGNHGLQVATVYLDDLNQAVRERQIRALMDDLEDDIPTLITGDLNMLRPNLSRAAFSVWARDMAIRSLGRIVPDKGLRMAIGEMNKRTGVPLVESYGYTDADRVMMRPTAPARFPAFGIDYMFHSDTVEVDNFEVKGAGTASDHLAIVADVRA